MKRTFPSAARSTGCLAAVALVGAVLAGCSDDTTPTSAEDSSSPSDTPTSSSTDPAPTPSSEPTATDEGESTTVPVYYVGETPRGPRLYREFHQVTGDDPLLEAARLLVAGEPDDPDYRSLLPDLGIDGVDQTSDAIVVHLSEDSPTTDKSLGSKDAALAVQSLVYTLQGTAQQRLGVQVDAGDTPVQLLGQPTDQPVKARPPLDVLALVNVTTPEEGATVSGTFTASGVASSFEATVPWQVVDSSGGVVLQGAATAEGYLDKLYPWKADVDVSGLEPGQYYFIAMTDDPSGGEGPGPDEDSKTIRVQ